MILEALNYAASLPVTAKAHRHAVGASVSLWSRASRCAAEWAEHETHCHAAVRASVAGLKQRRTAVVLGSGLLRDVPVAELARQFDTVVLVDLVHLASVRLWLRFSRLGNLRLIERDLSGLDAALAGETPRPLAFLRQVPYLDLVISANLLSQIGIGAERRTGKAAEGIAARLIAAHLDGLADLPCAACLLTDTAFRAVDRHGTLHQEGDLLRGVPAPAALARWQWPVIPPGEESRDYQVVHTVIASDMRQPEHFQQKCEAVLRPEMRPDKEIGPGATP